MREQTDIFEDCKKGLQRKLKIKRPQDQPRELKTLIHNTSLMEGGRKNMKHLLIAVLCAMILLTISRFARSQATNPGCNRLIVTLDTRNIELKSSTAMLGSIYHHTSDEIATQADIFDGPVVLVSLYVTHERHGASTLHDTHKSRISQCTACTNRAQCPYGSNKA